MAIWKHLEKPLRLAAFPMLSFPEGQKGSIINKNQFKAFFLFVQDWLVAWLVGWLVGWWGGRGGLHHRTWHSRNVGQRQGGDLVNLEGDFE